MPSPRILFVSANLDVGGSENQSAILLPALLNRGFELTILTLSGEGQAFHSLRTIGLDMHCAGMKRRTDICGLKQALSFAAGVKPDLVVSRSLSAQVVAQLIALRTRTPHVSVEHTSPGFPLRRHQRALLRLVAPRIDLVIAVSRAQLPRLIRLGYTGERIRVIPNGIVPVRPSYSRSAIRSQLHLRNGEFAAVLIANLRPLKRPELFLNSVVAANRANSRIRGLIVGAGPELSRISELAARTDGVVQTLGKRSDVADLLNAADVLCLTSLTESMPMTILEAMSLGRPVISTDVGGVHEVVSTGETGILIPANRCRQRFTAALLDLAANPARAKKFGRAGKIRQRRFFNSDRMIDAYASAFNEFARASTQARHLPTHHDA